ncbi:MAG: tetratricopeptide repeat protein [Pseudomonadota bacterium]
MAEKKITRKELLNEPDEFITFSGRAIGYVRENPRYAGFAALVVIACLAAGVVYSSYRSHRQSTSHDLFVQASRDYEEAVNGTEPASEEKLNKLFDRFDGIARDYGSLPAGEMALLYSGYVLSKKKDYKGALERYLKLESSRLAEEGLRDLFWYSVARTHMALKEYDKAAGIFDTLSKDTKSPYRREAYGAIARIYEFKDKKKEAVQAYRQYLKIFPEAPDAAFVKARIAELTARG